MIMRRKIPASSENSMPDMFPCALSVMTHLFRLIKTEMLYVPTHHAMKIYRGHGNNELNILNLSSNWI
jgi:hypothetical protein